MDPVVARFYDTEKTLHLTVSATFFETEGWEAPKRFYKATFKPQWWVSKQRGEVMIAFEDDTRKTKCVLSELMKHNLKVIAFDDSSDEESSEEEELKTPVPPATTHSVDPDKTQSVDSSLDSRPLSRRGPPSACPSPQYSLYAESDPFEGEAKSDSSEALERDLLALRAAQAAAKRKKKAAAAEKKRTGAGGNPDPDPDPDPSSEDEMPGLSGGSGDESDSSVEEANRLATERKNFGTIYETRTADRLQPVAKLDWTLVDTTELSGMCVRTKVDGVMGTEYGPRCLNKGDKELDSVYKIWKHLLPPTWIPTLVATANSRLFDAPVDQNYRKTSAGEVEAILGMMLGGAAMGVTSFEKCFAISSDTISPAAAFGQFGISKNRALTVMRSMHLSVGPQMPSGKDPHWFMDERMGEFNEHMRYAFRTGHQGTMDETGPMWHGGEGEGDFNMCPHVSYVPRKPEPVCALFNDICDSVSRVLVKLEFEKGAKYHQELKYMDSIGTYNAAMTTRLAEPFANSNAAVYGDSRFGSVKAAYWVWKEHKTHTAFDIKTATALFPRKHLVRLCPKEHGSIVVMTANIDGLTLYAFGQRRGPAVHTFLSTYGTFVKEIPHRYPKVTSLADAPWTTPSICNKITAAQPGIDAINRQLFDQLGLEYTFTTRCFETRFSQHFLFPITYVNAINFAKYDLPHIYDSSMTTKSIALELATCMVHNTAWTEMLNPHSGGGGGGGGGPSGTRSGGRYQESNKSWRQCRIDGGPPSRESPGKHVLIPLHQLEGYKGGKQQRCFECNELVSWCCARCSTPNCIIALHPTVAQGSKRKYDCLMQHRKNPCGGYKVTHQTCTGTSTDSKRRRKVRIQFI